MPEITEGTIGINDTSGLPQAAGTHSAISWQTDYQAAILDAVNRGKCLAVFFYAGADEAGLNAVAVATFARKEVRDPLSDMVRVQVPVTATFRVGSQEVVLLKHSSYRGLGGRPGLAVLDLRYANAPRYGTVVAACPLKPRVGWDAAQATALAMDLTTALRQAASESTSPQDEAGVVATSHVTGASAAKVDSEPALPATHIEPVRPRIPLRATPAPKPDAAPSSPATANVKPAPATASPAQPAPPLAWETDYAKALELATQRGAMLVLFFPSAGDARLGLQFERDVLAQPEVRGLLAKCVCAKLPLDATIQVDRKTTPILTHDSFGEMLSQPGLAMIDVRRKDSKWFGQVVSVFPFLDGQPYTVQQVLAMLHLPEGSLTQRTMIYAVAVHPEHPASITGRVDANLLHEAESHSEHQAQIQRQGHHNWSARFARINDALGDGMLAREVCAESWPGQTLVESAIECVRCWRLSSGHWGAVSSRQDAFGYDIKRGNNGIWYATGIFGSR